MKNSRTWPYRIQAHNEMFMRKREKIIDTYG